MRGRDIALFFLQYLAVYSSGSLLFNLVIVDNLLQEVFEDLVSWRGPGVFCSCSWYSDMSVPIWKWKLDTWELLSIIRCDLDCEMQLLEAGLAFLAFNCSVIWQFWSWKRRVVVLICGVQINFSLVLLRSVFLNFFLLWWGFDVSFGLFFLQ